MSADVLRRAAALIRNDHGGVVSRHAQDGRRWLPVADLLEAVADAWQISEPNYETSLRAEVVGHRHALAVARAYLEDQP